MTAEEKLRELYFEQESTQRVTYDGKGNATIDTTKHDGVFVSHKHIDMIANLVVERLCLYLDPERYEQERTEVKDG